MADELIEHRFVQIHQTCEKACSNIDEFWNTLAQTSTIAVSHGCEKVYARVTQNKDLDLLQTIQSLQNLILTYDEPKKNIVLLRTITRLLAFNEKLSGKSKISFYHCKTNFQQIHPYAVVMRQKPLLYFNLLEEVDFLIANESSAAIHILQGFISAIFLTKNAVDSNALLIRLTSAIMTIGLENDSAITSIYTCLCQILYKYPLQKENDKYLSLVDFLMWISIVSKPYQQLKADRNAIRTDDYMYVLIDRFVTASSKGYPVISYLSRLERMVDNSDHIASDILWVCLSYVLLKSQTVSEQQAIMQLMKPLCGKTTGTVSRIAYLPLYQLLSELNDKDASKELKALRDNTISMLSALDSNNDSANLDQKSNQLQNIIKSYCIYGLLAHILVYVDGFYKGIIPVFKNGFNTGPDCTLILNMLFSTPHVYSPDLDTQCTVYSRITELSSQLEKSCKFPMLLFLLRMLRASFDEPRLVTRLFKDVIPTLADPNDPTITSKVLQVILSSISSGDTMASLGVKALAHTHQRQPRVWQELKRVFAEWVLRRKSGTVRRKIDLSISGPIKLELAILTTMRDVCKTRPRECAPDVLPMVMSLLQTCQDLSMASLSILMASINHCINAGLVEPRSMWNVAVVYLAQFALDQGTQKSSLLVQELCKFYSIAGSRNDTSEPYLQFKETLLTGFVLPLIDSDDKEAAGHAMVALSDFPAQDIASILPEKASDYVQNATPADDCPNKSQHLVFATLISNELDHMRRGLFKEEANKRQTAAAYADSRKQASNDAGQVVGVRELELQAMLFQLWEDARVAPGLRSGYAIAMLYTLNSKDAQTNHTLEEISKTKWYRFMVTSFTDVSLTDHLLLRVSSVGSWKIFFQNALSGAKNELEAIVSVLLKDLSARLERSTVPGVTCNIAMAITGLVLVVQLYTPSYAATCANATIDMLMKNYIVLSGSPLSHSAHLMSEEVQFAARFALGHLATCIISNEKTIHTISKVLLDSATSTNNKYKSIDTSVDLVQFGNGYAAGHFVAALTAYSTMTEYVENLRTAGSATLERYCTLDNASDSRVIGIMMGLASKIQPERMCNEETVSNELDNASGKLKEYLKGGSISKGLLLGSTWVVALGAQQRYGVEYEYSNIIESVMVAASCDPNLAQHFYHFVVPYTQILYHGYIHADANDEASLSTYSQAFEPLFGSIQTDDSSSNYRIASLFGIASLLGADYLNRNAGNIYTEAQRYQALSRRAGLDQLAAITGLTVKSASTGNLKSGRIATAACGKVIAHTNMLIKTLASDHSAAESSAVDSIAALASASSEPTNYNRLNSNTSYLRAVFDKLTQIANDAISNARNITMLLQSLIKTPGPLPPVNWFALLLKLSKVSSDLQRLCFLFASTHAATSFSLSEYLATQTIALFKDINSLTCAQSKFLFARHDKYTENPFDAVLSLGGLPRIAREMKHGEKKRRGMNAVTKQISLSESRIIEIITQTTERFGLFDQDMQYQVLDTLADHLPSSTDSEPLNESRSKLVFDIRTLIFESVISRLIGDKSTSEIVLRKAVACTHINSIEQLFPTGRLEDWSNINIPMNHVIYLCETYHLSKNKQSIIKYISTAITFLIGDPSSIPCWRVVADMITGDCHTDKDALVWTIRVLDAFVVFISDYNTADQFEEDMLIKAIDTGFRSILVELRSSLENPSISQLQTADTAYLLNYFIDIGNNHKTEQEQITKRVFKLMGMADKLNQTKSVDFFNRVALGFPPSYLLQFETNY
ncbi:hypothetical protein [Parasitella parasitica]|uniref:DUF3730 domain-containing protein n=1 Tax=Parasitella parasitica TaxID=35722 RepID=A0A0B7NSY7_9FUNG|nr:hypothetical protein [Parasitella parasitica]